MAGVERQAHSGTSQSRGLYDCRDLGAPLSHHFEHDTSISREDVSLRSLVSRDGCREHAAVRLGSKYGLLWRFISPLPTNHQQIKDKPEGEDGLREATKAFAAQPKYADPRSCLRFIAAWEANPNAEASEPALRAFEDDLCRSLDGQP